MAAGAILPPMRLAGGWQRGVGRGSASAVCAILLAGGILGCASTAVVPPGPAQPPLVEQRQAKVGVFYPGAVRAAEFRSELVRMPYGAASVERLDQAFLALFSTVTRLPDWPPWRSSPPPVEAVIEVVESRLEVTPGNDLPGSGVFGEPAADRVRAAYRACLHRPDGVELACWWGRSSEVSHQRGFGDSLRSSLRWAADRAMRDAVADLMLTIAADPLTADWVESAPAAPAGLSPAVGSRLALLGWPIDASRRDELEEIGRRLRTALEREVPGVEIVDERRIREALYPLLEPSTQPLTEEALGALLAREDVRERLRMLRVERLLVYAGGESPAEQSGGGLCSYYGCYGYAWRSERSRLDAALWNIATAAKVETMEASAEGTTAIPVFVLPIVLRADTLGQACDRLGQRVATTFRELAPSPPPPQPQPQP